MPGWNLRRLITVATWTQAAAGTVPGSRGHGEAGGVRTCRPLGVLGEAPAVCYGYDVT